MEMFPTLSSTLDQDRFERTRAPVRTIEEARRFESELMEQRDLFKGATPAWDRDTSRLLADGLNGADTYYRNQNKHYSGKVIDAHKVPGSQAMWAEAADQAARRDAAHLVRQQELFDLSKDQLQKGDRLASYVTDAERRTERQQYISDVLSDCINKEIAIRHDPESDLVAEIRMDRDDASMKAGEYYDRHQQGVALLEGRQDHTQRQTAYGDLAAFAHEQGAGRAATFVEEYARFKAAQHDARVAEIGGNPREKAETQARLAEVRAVAVKAKENVKTSEIAALSRAMSARMENPRAFTQYMERKTQDAAKAEKPVEQSPIQTERKGAGIWTRKENMANLRAAGFEDTDAIRAAGKNTKWTERAVEAKNAGFKDESTIFALAQHERPFEKAMALKSQGMESQRQITVLAMREAPAPDKAPATVDDTASRLRSGNAATRAEAPEEKAKGFASIRRADRPESEQGEGKSEDVAARLRENNRKPPGEDKQLETGLTR